MPYTRVWDSSTPVGSAPAASLDTIIQQFKGDIEDRMEDKFITDITADPWVVKPEILGNVTDKILHLHHSVFSTHSNTNESRSINYVAPSQTGTYGFYGILPLPVGCTLKQVTGVFDRQSQTITIEVGYTDAVSGAFTSISSQTDNATAGIFQKQASAADFSHVVVAGRFYVINVTLPGVVFLSQFARFYGAFAKYDAPDGRYTI